MTFKTGLKTVFLICFLALALFPAAVLARDGENVTLELKTGVKALSGSVEIPKNGRLGALPAPKRKGYRFLGWYTGKTKGRKVTERTRVSSLKKLRLYAHWELIRYKIRYHYNGGSLTVCQAFIGCNPRTYTVRDKVVLTDPEREGLRFMGWYSSPDFREGTLLKEIPKGSSGKKQLYAKFVRYDGVIHFEPNGVMENAPVNLYCISGESYTLPGSDTPVLGCWNTNSDGTGTVYYPGQTVKDLAAGYRTITLYADAFTPGAGGRVGDLTRFFARNGYSKAAAAAIAGNLMFESGGGPDDIKLDAVEYATGRGIGMAQWTDTVDGPRRTRFEIYCGHRGVPWPNKDLTVQTMFLYKELCGEYGPIWKFLPRLGYPATYNMTLDQFKKIQDVALATNVFCACFERPKAADAHMSTRIAYARSAYKYVQ